LDTFDALGNVLRSGDLVYYPGKNQLYSGQIHYIDDTKIASVVVLRFGHSPAAFAPCMLVKHTLTQQQKRMKQWNDKTKELL
jgi:hypothetical protein